MNNDNYSKTSETANINTLQQLNQENDQPAQKSLFNPPEAQNFKTEELPNDNNKECQINNSSSILLSGTQSMLYNKSELNQSGLNKKTSYFSKKRLTLNKIKYGQRPVKEDLKSNQWAETMYKIEEGTPFGKMKLRIKYADYSIICFSFLSILFALIDNDLYIKNNQLLLNKHLVNEIKPIDLKIEDYMYIKSRVIELDENIIRIMNILASGLLFISIIMQYTFKVQLLKMDNKLSKYDGLASSGFISKMAIELILSILLFPPKAHLVFLIGDNNSYTLLSLNTVFNALTLGKFYFVFRITNYWLKWNKRAAQTITKSHRITSGMVFSLKCELKERPFITLIFSCLFFIIIGGLFIRSFEYSSMDVHTGLLGRKGINDIRNVFTAFWLIINTMTAVCYGDTAPRTFVGRSFIFASAVFGLLFTCLVIVNTSRFFNLTNEEAKAFLKLEKLHHRDNKEHKAANVIGILLFLRKFNQHHIERKTHCNHNVTFALFALLITHIKLMKNNYKIASSYAMPITDILQAIDRKLSENISSFTKSIEQLNEIEGDMEYIEAKQRETDESLTNIWLMQNEIALYFLNEFNNLSIKKNMKKKGNKIVKRVQSKASETINLKNKGSTKNCLANYPILKRYSHKHKKSAIFEGHNPKIMPIADEREERETPFKNDNKKQEIDKSIYISKSSMNSD